VTGRPSSFTQEVADELCERIACGESLKGILRSREDMPEERTVMRWLAANDGFRQQYTRAREAQADADADAVGDVGQRVLLGEVEPNAARVAIDALKWAAGKRNAKKYGDRLDLNHSGAIAQQTEEQIESRLAQLLRKAGVGDVAGGAGAPEATEPAG
jgi:hypothetical protein